MKKVWQYIRGFVKNLGSILIKWVGFKRSRNLLAVQTFQDWLDLPLSERQFFYFFYISPFALESGQWKRFHKYVEQNYKLHTFLSNFRFEIGYRWRRWVKDPIYYIKCRFFKKYHLINLGPYYHWMDSDTRIELALEKILIDFVEGEEPFRPDFIDWEHNENQVQLKKDILELYNYFKVEKPRLQKEYDDLLHKLFGPKEGESFGDFFDNLNKPVPPEVRVERDRLRKMEEDIENVLTEHLVKVVKLRHSLWT